MSIVIVPHPVPGSFSDFLFDFISRSEAFVPRVYTDGKGIPTLGVGYALIDRPSAQSPYRLRPGFADDLAAIGVTLNGTDQAYLNALLVILNSTVIDATQRTAAAGSLVPAWRVGESGDAAIRNNKFSFTLTTDAGRALFARVVENYEDIVRARLGIDEDDPLSGSYEMAALTSLSFNLPSLIGAGLIAAFRRGDRAEMWYEIRYGSNAGKADRPGLASRRYRESDVFGLYNAVGSVDVYEAKNVLAMYTRHRDNIATYERQFSPRSVNAQSAPIVENLVFAEETLITRYVSDLGLATSIVSAHGRVLVGADTTISFTRGQGSSASTVKYSKDDQIVASNESDLVFGEGGDDSLSTGEGSDVLYGGTGRDALKGGAGDDTYVYLPGDGKDTIFDSDGHGRVRIGLADGFIVTGARKSTAENEWTYAENGRVLVFTIKGNMRSAEGATLTISGPSLGGPGNTITVEHFKQQDSDKPNPSQPGSLGIRLTTDEKLELFADKPSSNPWDANIDHTPATGTTAVLKERFLRTVTVALAAPLRFAAPILLAVDVASEILRLVGGDEVIPFANGQAQLVVPAGQTMVTFGIWAEGDLQADEAVHLTATLLDENGDPGSNPVSHTITLNLDATDAAALPTGYATVLTPDYSAGNPTPYSDWGVWVSVEGGAAPEQIDAVLPEYIASHLARTGFFSKLYGGAGNDLINAHDDRDLAYGEEGNDVLIGSQGWGELTAAGTPVEGIGADFLSGGSGDDRLYGDGYHERAQFIDASVSGEGTSKQGDWLVGGYGDDELMGSAGKDILSGGAGSDVLLGGLGDDLLLGDADFSTEVLNWSYEIVSGENSYTWRLPNVVAGGVDAPIGSAGDEIHAGAGADFVAAGGGDDSVFGESGNDIVFGGAGDDSILGGDGDDFLNGDDGVSQLPANEHGDDFIDGGAGDDRLEGMGGADTLLGGDGNDELQGDGIGVIGGNDYLDGEDGDDVLVGAGGADILYGGAGEDQLSGDSSDTPEAEQGDDELYGEEGNDSLNGYGGDDYLDGGEGDDILGGGAGDDTLYGGAGNDDLQGQVGFDYLDGEGGDDHLFGGDDDDVLFGDAGNDQLVGEDGNDDLDGGEGDDTLIGDAGDDLLIGGEGNDVLAGGDGNDSLEGDAGADQLDGGAGDDTLDGGAGADVLVGGIGHDRYLLDAMDQIVDADGDAVLQFTDGTQADDLALVSVQDGSTTYEALVLRDEERYLYLSPVNRFAATTSYTFADGSSLTQQQFLALRLEESQQLTGDVDDDTLYGYAGDDLLSGGEGADKLIGNRGNDVLYGEGGDDVLQGGEGNDTLVGGQGSDVYFFARGDGQDSVSDGGDTGSFDSLVFDADILLGDVDLVHQANGDLVLRLAGSADQVTVSGWYTTPENRIESIVFGDGTELGEVDLLALPIAATLGTSGDDLLTGGDFADHLVGLGGADTLDGGLGDDTLEGSEGFDTYLLSLGGGEDVVVDASPEGSRILLAAGLALDDLAAHREGNDLLISIRGTHDALRIQGYYTSAQTWTAQDSNGAVASATALIAQTEQAPADEEAYADQLLGDFLRARRAQIVGEYRAEGYSLVGTDSLHKPVNLETQLGAWVTRDTLTQSLSVPVQGGGPSTTSATSATYQWSGVTPLLFESDAQIDSTVIQSDALSVDVPETYVTSTSVTRRATLAVTWSSPRGQVTMSSSTSSAPSFVQPYVYGPDGELIGTYIGDVVSTVTQTHLSGTATGTITGILSLGPEISNLDPFWDYFTETSSGGFGTGKPPQIDAGLAITSTTIPITAVVGGDSDNIIGYGHTADIVLGGGGNDNLNATFAAYGGEGDDQVYALDTAMGGSGDDRVMGGRRVVGGAGSDVLVGLDGATVFAIDPPELGADQVFDVGDASARYDRWYYGGLGISVYDEQRRRAHPDTYEVHFNAPYGDSAFTSYLASLDDIAPYLATLGPNASYEVRGYVPALPALPNVLANDYAALAPLYAAGVIDQDVVSFGAGVTLADMSLSWIIVDADTDNPYAALELEWDAGHSVSILIPHSDDLLGYGIEAVAFADGTRIGMGDLIAIAGPHPDFDPHLAPRHLIGTPGDDVLNGGRGNDTLEGLGGNDALYGGQGADVLLGGEGDDTLSGYEGDDTLEGGVGNDSLSGELGYDTYRFGRGDGQDQIAGGVSDPADQDRVLFAADLVPQDIQVFRDPYSLYLKITGTSDQVQLSEWFTYQHSAVQSVEFADGTIWNASELEARIVQPNGTTGDDLIYAGAGDDIIDALAGNDHVWGNAGDDVLRGGAGDDQLEAGEGDDLLYGQDGDDWLSSGYTRDVLEGGAGSDFLQVDSSAAFVAGGPGDDLLQIAYDNRSVIAFNLGDGHDTLYQFYADPQTSFLTISLNDVPGADLYLCRDGDDLVLHVGTNDSLRFAGWQFLAPEAQPHLELQIIDDVRVYDLSAAIAQFEAQGSAGPAFALEPVLPSLLLWSSATHAVGGDLAVAYAQTGSTEAISPAAARSVVADADFGLQAQALSQPLGQGNHAPALSAPDLSLALNASVAASTLFAATDADGDTITHYEFWDGTARTSSAGFVLSGTAQPANQTIAVAAEDLSDLTVTAGSVAGADQLFIRAYDGQAWSTWASFTLISGSPAAPVVSASAQQLALQQDVAASSVFSVSDANGDAMAQYEFWDATSLAGSATFLVDGVEQAANASILVAAEDLGQVQVRAGTRSATDQLWVRANDGGLWSDWVAFDVVSGTAHAPQVQAIGHSLQIAQQVAAAGLFEATDADGDSLTRYELWDGTEREGSAAFLVNGVAQPANQSVLISAAQLQQVQIQGGARTGTDELAVRAYDGQLWSEWTTFTLTTGTPHAPVMAAADLTLALDADVALASLFSVTDADGDTPSGYEFFDATERAGSAVVFIDGVVQPANQTIAVSAQDLAQAHLHAGSTSGLDQAWVRATDGQLWSEWVQFTLTSGTPVAPVVSAPDHTLVLNETVTAASLFTVSDADGDAITQYEFWDGTDRSDSAFFSIGAVAQPTNQVIAVTTAQLADTVLMGGSATGVDQLWVRASDGQLWSDWVEFDVTTGQPLAPVVTASPASIDPNASVAASSLFSVSDGNGDAMVQYELWDATARDGSAQFLVAGLAQAANQTIALTAAQLAGTTLQGGSLTGTDQMWVRAYDGQLWSDWAQFTVTTGTPHAPQVSVADQALALNATSAAAELFDYSDADAEAAVSYELWDGTDRAGGAYFAVDGVAQGANQTIAVTASQLAATQLVAGSATGTDQLWVRASDGQLWSEWGQFTLTSGNPYAPVVTGSDQTIPLETVVTAANLFSAADANGDTLTYQLWDGNGDPASAYFTLDGVAQGANQNIDLSAAQWASTQLHAAAEAQSDQLWLRVSDGQLWSDWKSLNLTTSDGLLRTGTAGADTLVGGSASDILQGHAGDDALTDAGGNNLLDGAAGADNLSGGAGNDLLLGGTGNDTLQPGAGTNVIGFNVGDGQDTLVGATGATDTLSLGGGIRYEDLALRKSGDDLVLDTGNSDAIALKDWYASGTHSVAKLQLIAEAMPEFDPGSADALLNKKVQQFDFSALAAAYDQARTADPLLGQWSLIDALLDAHLAASDSEALGGDLGYRYGQTGSLAGVGFGAAENVLKSSQFGSQAQTLQPPASLNEGLVKLA